MSKTKEKSKRVTITLIPEDSEFIDQMIQDSDVKITVSGIIRAALKKYKKSKEVKK